MSYSYYDPNYDFYYYDDYPDTDIFFDETPFEYYVPETRGKRKKHAILAKTLEEPLSDDDMSSRYLVPVVYAPTRVTDSTKLLDNEPFSENIDVYYSDRKNIENEAKLFRQYAQPYYYASTIQEESESTASSLGHCCMKHKKMQVSENKLDSCKDHRYEVRTVEKLHDNGVKTHKLKKRIKCSHNVNGGSKKVKKKIEEPKLDKPETSNSWTTLLSGSIPPRNTKPDVQNKLDEAVGQELPAKKSKSWVCVSDRSKTSVKFSIQTDNSSKDVNKVSNSELQAVRDTDKVLDDEEMRNASYPSTSNVQAMAAVTVMNNAPSGLVAWTNKSMKHDSSTTDTSKMSCAPDLKSNITIPDVSETTDITINSGEYREFLHTINKIKPENVPNQHMINYDKSSQNLSVHNNNKTNHKLMVQAADSSETFLENMIRVKQAAEERQYLKKRVNPLIEVPLSISSRGMYWPSLPISDFPSVRKADSENKLISKKKSIFIKVFRTVADVIACCQNYAYKYVLRFILFV